MISIRQIEYFIAVAEAEQILKTATALHVSQSTITTAIKNLEDLLNVKLFVRHQKGVELTYEGSILLSHAKNVMASLEEVLALSGNTKIGVTGKIRLAISFTVSGYFMAGLYARFCRSFPKVEIQMTEAGRSEIEEGLASDLYDIGLFNVSNLENQDELASETIIRSNRRLWVNAGHEFLNRSTVSLKDVAEQPYVMITVDEASRTSQRYWSKTPYRPKVIFRTNSIEAIRNMVANGSGVTILADMVYRPWSQEGRRVEIINLRDEIPSFDIGLVWHKNKELSPAALAFRNFLNLAAGIRQNSQGSG